MTIRIAILTISDAGSRGERADTSGDRIAAWAAERGFALAGRTLVPDESVEIVHALLEWCDGGSADVVLTTGGTGLTPRDVTPEATRAVLEREAPGIAEAIRRVSDGDGRGFGMLSLTGLCHDPLRASLAEITTN